MAPMFGWVRHRRHAAHVNERFVTESLDALHALHRRLWDVERQMQAQQMTNRELERRTARAEAEAAVARLELPNGVQEYAPTADAPSFEPQRSTELLDDLFPVPSPASPADQRTRLQSDLDAAHLLFFPTSEGYELVELSAAVPTLGDVVDLGEHGLGEVVKVGRSPLPNDAGRCFYLLPVAGTPEETRMPERQSESLALFGSR
jgi:hypothetical protein